MPRRTATIATWVSVLAVVFSIGACRHGHDTSNAQKQDAGKNAEAFVNTAPDVGASCTPDDDSAPSGRSADGGSAPHSTDPSATADATKLAPGVGFCLHGSQAYPNGYFTSNCASDADCPKGAKCDDGGLCRATCSGDSACKAPMTCRPHGSPPLHSASARRALSVAVCPDGHAIGCTAPTRTICDRGRSCGRDTTLRASTATRSPR